ncbi:hypothetical protein LZK98_13575 [Sphingomonas cannabina]|uniref:hypothetical protein n=1 Tax=Sphingomonas cannabina TaxID=2899123 RepID=UPI001F1862D8|nr:hypothetical protein [Sphingomonas cannabina]UIJ44104.1 hypothetical protein LZK98_13575 [Sphingomonas cannabina]
MAHVPDHFTHFAAIDWSGAVGPRQPGIAVALCTRDGGPPALVRPGHVWSRVDVLDWLRHGLPPATLVGLDLGMSLPFADRGAFFPSWSESPPDARALWALVDHLCEADPHLAASSFVDHAEASRHFRRHGGRAGDQFEPGRGRLRVTEIAQREQGLNPYSNLNLVGAAQVGKSSLTGMRLLHRLKDALPIWPFDPAPAAGSLIVEIYTSIAARDAGRPRGRTKMKTMEALNQALVSPAIASAPVPGAGPIDDHSSDALLTAAWLRACARRKELWRPAALVPALAHTEGWTFGIT